MHSQNGKIIALCGHPQHGKSTVQSFLEQDFGVTPVDDGFLIRQEAMKRHGFTWEDVSTQEGKLRQVTLDGETVTIRKILGDIGKEHEDTDPNHWPKMAVASCSVEDFPISLGSVRRNQNVYLRSIGALVIEIVNPRLAESPYDFDQYNRDAVHCTIINDGTLDDLRRKTAEAVTHYLGEQA